MQQETDGYSSDFLSIYGQKSDLAIYWSCKNADMVFLEHHLHIILNKISCKIFIYFNIILNNRCSSKTTVHLHTMTDSLQNDETIISMVDGLAGLWDGLQGAPT